MRGAAPGRGSALLVILWTSAALIPGTLNQGPHLLVQATQLRPQVEPEETVYGAEGHDRHGGRCAVHEVDWDD